MTEVGNTLFLQDYLKPEGIKFECTVGYASEQNGIAERKNRSLMEAASAGGQKPPILLTM